MLFVYITAYSKAEAGSASIGNIGLSYANQRVMETINETIEAEFTMTQSSARPK